MGAGQAGQVGQAGQGGAALRLASSHVLSRVHLVCLLESLLYATAELWALRVKFNVSGQDAVSLIQNLFAI